MVLDRHANPIVQVVQSERFREDLQAHVDAEKNTDKRKGSKGKGKVLPVEDLITVSDDDDIGHSKRSRVEVSHARI